uniref:Uncharacterized protein n=1 Tax=Glossina austeni TaxID=7395 RepID=A0A1A9VVU0_GLOAU
MKILNNLLVLNDVILFFVFCFAGWNDDDNHDVVDVGLIPGVRVGNDRKGCSAEDTKATICTIYGSGPTTIRVIGNWVKELRGGNFDLKNEGPTTTDTELIKSMLTDKSLIRYGRDSGCH